MGMDAFLRNVALAAVAMVAWMSAALVEVHRAEPTVDAVPYLDGAAGPDEAEAGAAVERGVRDLPREFGRFPERYPVEPGPLRRGSPRTVEGAPGGRAFFVVGRNDAAWMRRNAGRLRGLGAVGYVVDAPTARDYLALRREAVAEGLVVVPVPGRAVAEIGGPGTYPVVVVPREGQGDGS